MGFRGGLLGWMLVLGNCCAFAQETPTQAGPIHTLRVFTNLIQIPTLVLDENGQPVERKIPPKFTVSLDHGKPFAPTHVRVEGDDPLTLGVLLDAGGGQQEILSSMGYQLGMLVEHQYLKPHDHVTVFAVDCTVVRALVDAPADRTTLKFAIESALKEKEVHGGSRTHSCADTLKLYDTVASLAKEIGQYPGRRVLLAVTSGVDYGSTASVEDVREATRRNRVTLVGIAAPPARSPAGQRGMYTATAVWAFDPGFDALCQTSGGLMVVADDTTLKFKLEGLLHMLRARFVIEFPRADSLSSGGHLLIVDVPGKHYTIRPSEATVPIADQELRNDPNVLTTSGVQSGAEQESQPAPRPPELQ